MSRGRRANPAVIGVFVLGAIVLTTAVAVVWGSGRFFRHTVTFVSYFGGSVNGLNLGAPVKFRGVQIGSITEIRSRMERAGTVEPDQFRIPVWFELDPKQIAELGGTIVLDRGQIDQMITQGLRAQLQLESIVTGVLYLGVDFFPDSSVVLVQANRPEILEIPTVPTSLERASQVVTKFLGQIDKLDIDAAVHSITEAFDGVNGLVRSPELAHAVAAAHEALDAIRHLSDDAAPGVRPMMGGITSTSARARESLQHLDGALADLQTLIDVEGPLSVELTRTVVDLGDAARSVRDLASYLERNPNALLVGRPAP